MNLNPVVIIIFSFIVIIFFVMFFIRNNKDKEELVEQIKEGQNIPRDETTHTEQASVNTPNI